MSALRSAQYTCSPVALYRQLEAWLKRFAQFAWLDSNQNPTDTLGEWAFRIGWRGDLAQITTETELLKSDQRALCFGTVGYEWLHTLEPIVPRPPAAFTPWPDIAFFRAEAWLDCARADFHPDQCTVTLHAAEPDALWAELWQTVPETPVTQESVPQFRSNFTPETYQASVEQVRELIRLGDLYELNLTQRYGAQDVQLHAPLALWRRLQALSPMPMGAVLRCGERWLLGASPERFLMGDAAGQLWSQPIKGTLPRLADPAADAAQAQLLQTSEKQRAENVMIVDLVRNDLHRVCVPGSVQVPALFAVHSLPRVHQLVSTVTGVLEPPHTAMDALRAAFPPGSMTGAPKVRAMQRIAELEGEGRGIYSGAVGWWQPGAGFDLAVVIRSLVYDAAAQRLSYHVGGAITWDSDPAEEYAESELKAGAIRELWG